MNHLGILYEPGILWSNLIGQLEVHIFLTYESSFENQVSNREGSSGDTPLSSAIIVGTS